MSKRFRGDDDAGAFAILFAILVVLLVMIAALIIDIGLLRVDRGDERSAADGAATAGAGDLSPTVSSSVAQACSTAFDYTRYLREAGDPVAAPPCSSLVPTGQCNPASTPAKSVSGTIGRWTVTVTYPVPDASPLMGQQIGGDGVTQPITSDDGTPCERLGVAVTAHRDFVFAGVGGFSGSTTGQHSVARATPITTGPGTPVSLVTFDPDGCHSIRAFDSGITVKADNGATPFSGIVAVNSSGLGGNGYNDCNGSHTVIETSETGDGYLRVEATNAGVPGHIYQTAAGTRPAKAYDQTFPNPTCDPTDPSMTNTELCPQPEPLAVPVTRDDWENRWNISALDSREGLFVPLPGGWTALPTTVCTTTAPLYFARGRYYVPCPTGWTVTQNVGFEEGSEVVLEGGLDVQDGGCLVIGVVPNPPTTPEVTRDVICADPGSSVNNTADASILYVQNNEGINREDNGNLVLVHTVVRSDGRLEVEPGGSGSPLLVSARSTRRSVPRPGVLE